MLYLDSLLSKDILGTGFDLSVSEKHFCNNFSGFASSRVGHRDWLKTQAKSSTEFYSFIGDVLETNIMDLKTNEL